MLQARAVLVGLSLSTWSAAALAQSGGSAGSVPAAAEPAPVAPAAEAPAEPAALPPAAPAAAPPVEPTPAKPAPTYPRVRWADDVGQSDAVAPTDAASDEAQGDEDALPPTSEGPWRLRGRHFVLSLERMTSILSWNKKATVKLIDSSGRITEREAEASGVDLAFLGGGGAQRTASSLPRVAFDGVVGGGFTFGGSVSYMHTSGKAESSVTDQELPQADVLIFSPRLGVLLSASDSIGVWLRGGLTRTSIAASGTVQTTSGGSTDVEETTTLWNLALEPQLVLVPVPRVGFTLGIIADIALDGLTETRVSGAPNTEIAVMHSAFGVAGGLAAIF